MLDQQIWALLGGYVHFTDYMFSCMENVTVHKDCLENLGYLN